MSQTYTKTAISLHWLIALNIAIVFSIGVYMHELPLSPHKLQIYSYHKWAGITVFLLVLFRLMWRYLHSPPPLPETMPIWEKEISEVVHYFLYFLMLAIPLSGWLMSSAAGFPVVLFGIIPLPDLISKDKELAGLFKQLHFFLNMSLFLLVFLHSVAALKHHFIAKDNVLIQMLPFLKREKTL
jgi:cytochrome b561